MSTDLARELAPAAADAGAIRKGAGLQWPRRARLRLADLWPFLLTSAAIALAYRPTLLGNGHIPYDLEYYHYPLLATIQAHLSHGTLPIWDPDSYGGVPLVTNAQSAWLYPPHLLLDGVLSLLNTSLSERAVELLALLHVWIAGMGMCLLARSRALSRPAAAFAGSFLVLTGATVAQSQHLGMVETLAWLPLALLAVDRLRAGVTAARIAVLAALALLIVSAGFLPLVVACATLLLVYAATGRRAALGGTFAGLALGAAAASAMLLPLLALLSYFPPLDVHGALPTSDLVTAVVPNALGHWMGSLAQYTGRHSLTNAYYYVGAGALVALPLALTTGRRVVRDAAIAAGMLLLSFGALAGAIARFVQGLPTIGHLYRPEDFAYVAVVPLALTLAHGFDRRPTGREIIAMAGFLVVLVLVPLGTGIGTNVHLLGSAPRRELLGLLVAGGLAVLAWRAREARVSRGALALLAVVAVVELASTIPSRYFVNAAGPPTRASATQPADGSRVVTFLRRTLRPGERIAADGSHLAREWTAFSPLWRLQNADGLEPQFSRYQLERVRALGAPLGELDRVFPVVPAELPYLREMDARYVVVSPAADEFAGASRFTRVYADALYRVYRVDGAQARAFEVSRACLARHGAHPLAACASTPASATIVSDTQRRLRLTDANHARLLVTGEPYYPGWSASSAQGGLPVRRLDYLAAVVVPAGVDSVTLRYRPPGLMPGIALTLLCALLGGVVLMRRLRAAHRARTRSGEVAG